MQVQAKTHDQSWRIHFTSKAKNFNFRLRFIATNNNNNNNPTWTFSLSRFSLVLKLRKFFLRINSHPTQTQPPIIIIQFLSNKNNKLGFIRTKVMNFVHKFRARVSNKRPLNVNIVAAKRESSLPYPKDPIHIGFWVMGFLAFKVQYISKKDQKGIMMFASVGCFVASLLFKPLKLAKLVNLAAFLLVLATIVCYLFSYFDHYFLDYMARCSWNV